MTLPPSLAASPNIPWEDQTLEQLYLERDYWRKKLETAPGFASAKAAQDFLLSTESWIKRQEGEQRV